MQWIRKLIRAVTGRITGQVVGDLNETTTEILLEDSDNYLIEYETPAPTATEKEIANGKEVTISGPDEVEYTDVIAFTELNNSVSVLDSMIVFKALRNEISLISVILSIRSFLSSIVFMTVNLLPFTKIQTFCIIISKAG